MEDIKLQTGTNYDYILALHFDGEKLHKIQIPIERNLKLCESLISKLDNSDSNAYDMHMELQRGIRSRIGFQCCLKYRYTDSYISDIEFPDFHPSLHIKSIETFREKKMKMFSDELKYHPGRKEEIEHKVDVLVLRKQREDKVKFLKKYIPYIYASDYQMTLEKNHIKENYKLYSNEVHGRCSYIQEVNNDFKIKTSTNFCYGSSSYFYVIISYKGIELLPYSAWIKYYFAGYNELIKYTRCYYPTRDSWHYCMDFITDYINAAIKDPEKFVREDIMREVNEMREGLEKIMVMDDTRFSVLLDVKQIEEDTTRYIGITAARHANDRDRAYYSISPSECALVYKMEKICGALHFLDSLLQLSEIYSEIQYTIDRIKEMNQNIYPEVVKFIPSIKSDIKVLEWKYKCINGEYDRKEAKFKKLKMELEKLLNKPGNSRNREEIECEFRKCHPSYEDLESSLKDLLLEKIEVEEKIKSRKTLFSKIISFKELIEYKVCNV